MEPHNLAHECTESLVRAHHMLSSGCDALLASTGLRLEPGYLAHALRAPELSAQICTSIEQACSEVHDKYKLEMAKAAVEAISRGALALKDALGHIADLQTHGAKAISAYTDNS